MKEYDKCPFTISDYQYFRDDNCPKFSMKNNRYTGGVWIEFCSLEENVVRYNKLGARIISCEGCKFRENNYKETTDAKVNNESTNPNIPTGGGRKDSAMYLLRHME